MLSLRVLDVKGRAISGALVKAKGHSFKTGPAGFLHRVGIPSGQALVQVSRAGYAPTFRRIRVGPGGVNSTNIYLEPVNTFTLSNLSGAFRIKQKGLEIEFPAGTFAGPGPAKLKLALLNVDGPSIRAMPGEFQGRSSGGRIVTLESYGALSLQVLAGNKLQQIRKGHFITLRFPCPAGLKPKLKSAPFWSFHEQKGLWLEEGAVQIQRGDGRCRIQARLPHLTWWNVDVPVKWRSSILVESFVNEKGEKLETPELRARGKSFNGISYPVYGAGNKKGSVCLDVKANSTMELKAVFYSKSIQYNSVKNVKSGPPGPSCRRKPGAGLLIKQMVLKQSPKTCIRVQFKTKKPALVRVLRDNGNMYQFALNPDGKFCMDDVWVGEQILMIPRERSFTSKCTRTGPGRLQLKVTKAGAVSCKLDFNSCEDLGSYEVNRCRNEIF